MTEKRRRKSQVEDNPSNKEKQNGDIELSKPKEIAEKPAKQRSHYEEVDTIVDELHCCVKLKHKFWFKIFVFLLVVGLDSVDLISDWLLFNDVISTKEGLVYGPPEASITYSLLAFSIIGSFTFLFEVVNLWWEIFRENPWINTDLASAITIWIEDVPQIVINVFLALCREEGISYFQLVKACVVIFGIVIRIIVSLIRYCSKKNLAEVTEHTKQSCRHVTYRAFIMIGLIIIFGSAIAVFMLTQFQRTEDGRIKFNVPKSLFTGKYDDERYFTNVSIYFNHPFMEYNNNASGGEENFIRLISIFDVREKKREVFKLSYDEATKTKFVIWQTGASGNLEAQECYTIDRSAETVTRASGPCSAFLSGQTISSFIFAFHFIDIELPKLVFGDIDFNILVNESGVCHKPVTEIVNMLKKRKGGSTSQDAVIHYYKTKPGISQDHHLLYSAGGQPKFFQPDKELTDIKEVWKTGFTSCESTGSLAPHQDASIPVDCKI